MFPMGIPYDEDNPLNELNDLDPDAYSLAYDDSRMQTE
jgi:hypothetical protein